VPVKVGDLVQVRLHANSMWAGQPATIVALHETDQKLLRLRFRDGAELWFSRKEILRGS
jgi:hypothetical protein